MSRRQRLRSTLRGSAGTVIAQDANIWSIPARALSMRRASCRLPRLRNPASRARKAGHKSSRSTSTRPSARTWARNEGSTSASLSSTTSTGRPISRVNFVARSTTRSKLASRKSTSTSTSLPGVSIPTAAEPNSSAKRTFCSVRSAARSVATRPHDRRTYSRSPKGSWSLRGASLFPRSAPRFTARRNVRSLTPTSSASNVKLFMCPLCHVDASTFYDSPLRSSTAASCLPTTISREPVTLGDCRPFTQ